MRAVTVEGATSSGREALAWCTSLLAGLPLAAAWPHRSHPCLYIPVIVPHPAEDCRRDATLQLGDLEKYGVADTQALYTVIYGGRGSMPG